MRVICICCYRNEADIIEVFVRHTANYCDELVLLDHGSTDESPEIVHHLQREGLALHLVADPTLGNVEADQTNRLLRFAANELSADWILSLDADEFISGAADNSFLPVAVEEETTCLKVRSRSYYAHASDRDEVLNPVERITHRLATEEESDLKVFVPGWLARRGDGYLSQGKHQYFLHTQEAPAPIIADVALAHFSIRSPAQYAMKLASKQLQKCRYISKQGDELVYYNKPYALLKESYTQFQETFASQRLAYKLQQPDGNLVNDPLAYRGGPLSYTPEKSTGADRFIREVLELSEELARSSTSTPFEASTNGASHPRTVSIELTSAPSPGHTEVLNAPVDRTRFQTVMLALDCPADTSELLLSLRADPGLIEISEIVLNYASARRGIAYGVEKLQTMTRILEGGSVIAPTDVFRVLTSKEPVRLVFKGWRKPGGELPNELLLRLRVEHQLVPAVFLSSIVLNAMAAEQRELISCRAKLETARREANLYKGYLSKSAYSVGSIINFTINGNSSFYLGHGWSHAEEWGTWTDGERAILHIRFDEAPKRPLRISAKVAPFLHELRPELQVRVIVGGDEMEFWAFESSGVSIVHAEIPADKLREKDCEIVFEILDAKSPLELGIANDPRHLGLGFRALDLQWADAVSENDSTSVSGSGADGNVS